MHFFWKRQESVINKINDYLDQVDTCRDRFLVCMRHLIEGETGAEGTKPLVENVHAAEARADDLRRDIEMELYRRALIPESRGDVLGLLESFDRIPGDFESLCFQMSLQRIRIPTELRAMALRLLDVNCQAYSSLREAFSNLFYSRSIMDHVKIIDQRESESDHIERSLVERLFEMDIDKADRILLKEVVVNIGDISDLAQSTADRLTIAVVKRRI